MLRQGIILLILTSMVLHCASRMNFLSYLHEQRQEIAHSLGIIPEVPIAVCSGDYDFNKGLSIADQDDNQAPIHVQVQEINLFFGVNTVCAIEQTLGSTEELSFAPYSTKYHLRPSQDIFLPPKV